MRWWGFYVLVVFAMQPLNAQQASAGRANIHEDTSAIAMAMDAKNVAVLAVLQKLTTCNAKKRFYQPNDASADADGCVSPQASPVRLTKTFEQYFCVYGTCGSRPNRSKMTKSWTTPVADLCVLSGASGYAGGLWGECKISGAPGSTWNVFGSQAGDTIVSCHVTCFDAD